VEKTQEKAMSFLPETPPEKVKISSDIIDQVKDNPELKGVILESLKLAFEHKFIEAKANLDWFKKDMQCSTEEMQEISRRVDVEKQFIDQLETISHWTVLGNIDNRDTIETCIKIAKLKWEEAIWKSKKMGNSRAFFSLLEIGLSKKGWLDPVNKENYETMFAELKDEVDQRLEKTWMCHLMNRAYKALRSSHHISVDPNSVEIPDDAKANEALSYLCRLVKYFHRLGNHDKLLHATVEKIVLILKTKPIDVDECSNIFYSCSQLLYFLRHRGFVLRHKWNVLGYR
jgi:hypothetical protein